MLDLMRILFSAKLVIYLHCFAFSLTLVPAILLHVRVKNIFTHLRLLNHWEGLEGAEGFGCVVNENSKVDGNYKREDLKRSFSNISVYLFSTSSFLKKLVLRIS